MTVLEIATLVVRDGVGDQFVEAYQNARSHVLTDPGVHWITLARGIESPDTFVLTVEWDNVAAHETFRGGADFGRWRSEIGPYLACPPTAAHYQQL